MHMEPVENLKGTMGELALAKLLEQKGEGTRIEVVQACPHHIQCTLLVLQCLYGAQHILHGAVTDNRIGFPRVDPGHPLPQLSVC